MISVKTTAHVGADGTLTLAVPTPLRETDVEVMVVVQPMTTPQERGWPPGFFKATAGGWRGGAMERGPQERGPQGEYEQREELA